MSYAVLSRTIWTTAANTYTAELLENGYVGSVLDFQVTGCQIRWNQNESDLDGIVKMVQGSNVSIAFRDANRAIVTRMINAEQTQFRIDIYKDGLLFWRGFVLPFSVEFDPYWTNTAVNITAVDGIGILKELPFDLVGYYTLSELFRAILDTVGHSIDIKILTNYKEKNASGTLLPDLLRLSVEGLQRMNANELSYFDVLESLLMRFNLQLCQCSVNGTATTWTILQRSLRTGTVTVFTVPTSSGATTSASVNVSVNTSGSDVLRASTRSFIQPVKTVVSQHLTGWAERELFIENADWEAVSEDGGTVQQWMITGNDYVINVSPFDNSITLTADGTSLKQRFRQIFSTQFVFDIEIDCTIQTGVSVTSGPDLVYIGYLTCKDADTGLVYYFNKASNSWTTTVTPLRQALSITVPGAINFTFTISDPCNGTSFPGVPGTYLELELAWIQTQNENQDTITFGKIQTIVTSVPAGFSGARNSVTTAQNNKGVYLQEHLIADAWPISNGYQAWPLEYYDGTRWPFASEWNFYGGDRSLNDVTAREILSMFSGNLINWAFQSRINSGIEMWRSIVYDGVTYAVYALTLDLRDGFSDVSACQLRTDGTAFSDKFETFTE